MVLWASPVISDTATRSPLPAARASLVEAVCIRSDNVRLENAIGGFHQKEIAVYAWRWPAVLPKPGSKTHWYAKDEAAFDVTHGSWIPEDHLGLYQGLHDRYTIDSAAVGCGRLEAG
jgi:hypothetical protein